MPRLQTLLSELNHIFGPQAAINVRSQREIFAPGQPLGAALAGLIREPGSPEYVAFKTYIEGIPAAIQEGLRSTIYLALGTDQPTYITCVWAPGYDFEATYWQAPDTPETPGGISILMKSRYPSDPHPIG